MMGGFHLDNSVLEAKGLLSVKGAPQTFDCVGFTGLVSDIKEGNIQKFPTFDRALDRVIPEGGHPIDIPNVETPEFEAMLREAVKLGNLDLQQRERNGQTLAAYAEAQGKTEASSILRRLAS